MANLIICVGTTNPGKITAVTMALATYPVQAIWPQSVNSGVSVQPMTDAETRLGAQHRAERALEAGLAQAVAAPVETNPKHPEQPIYLGIGLEGGVELDEAGQMWNTVWVVVVDQTGQRYEAGGLRFPIPKLVADRIRAGQEMGPAMDELMGQTNLKQGQGMIGIITKGKVSRALAYASLVGLAVGQWWGRSWSVGLTESSK